MVAANDGGQFPGNPDLRCARCVSPKGSNTIDPVLIPLSSEVLNGEWYMNSPTDIWSLGIILGIVLTGESPFPNHQYSRVGRMKLKRQVSSDAMDLLARCLHTDPADRAHISCVAKHRWLRGPMAHRGSV